MAFHRPGQRATTLLTVAAVAAGLAASLGAGYTAAKATLGDASTYVAKGDAVSHVNGESRQVDATSPGGLAKNLEDVDTTPLPNGKVVAVNRQTHKVSIIDGATLERRTAEAGRSGGAAQVPPVVVVSGRAGWLLDHSARSVRQVGAGDGKRVRLDGQPVDGAPGRDGSLIVLTDSGKLRRVGTDGTVRDIDWPDARGASLTVAGDHSYLVQVGGDVVEVDSGTPVKVANVEGATGLRNGRMLINSQQTGGAHVLIVQATQVVVIDPVAGKFLYRIRHGATTQNLGEPVEYRNRIYLPDYDHHTVIVLDEKTQLPLPKPITVPGSRGTFSVTVDGDRLWANDQYSNRMVEIDVDGTHTIDKGKGNGVSGDKPKPTTPKPGATRPPPNSTVPPRTPPRTPPSTPTTPSTPNTPANPTTPTKRVTVPGGLTGSKYQDACSRIEQAQLRCQPVAAGEDGGDTDDVIDSQPASGTSVPEGTLVVVRYYGPTTVPEIPSLTTTPAEQCRAVEQAKLTCAVKPATQPATSIDQFGYVADSNPAPGSQASTGDTVTITYYAGFRMPEYSNTSPGTPGASTCQALSARTVQLPGGQTRKLTCNVTAGDKETNAVANAGAVYAQSPAAGQVVTVDQTITLTTYAGEHRVKDYANADGGDAGAAQADCRKWFSGCELKKGDVPVGHAQDVNKVQKTDPGSGATVKVGDNVDIIVWRDTTEVPQVTGLGIDEACTRIANAGLQCDRNSSHPYSKQVGIAAPNGYPVSPAEGTSVSLGSTVVVPNANVQPVNIVKYHSTRDARVWVLRVEGNVPEGYDPAGEQVTTAYRDGQVNGGNTIRGFFCSDCYGHSPNHYVTRDTQPANSEWSGGQSTGVQLLPSSGGAESCTAPGTAPVWRTSDRNTDNNKDVRTYDIRTSLQKPGSWFDEFLGCGLG